MSIQSILEKEIENPNEREIAELLNGFNFNFIKSNLTIIDVHNKPIGEIDLIFEYEDYLLLIEVTAQSKKVHESAGNWFSKWSSPANLELLFKTLEIQRHKIIRIFIDLTHKRNEDRLASLQHHLRNSDNKYLFGDDIEYFKNYYFQIKQFAKNDFLSYIDFPRKNYLKKVSATKFYINKIPAYSFVIPVNELLEICYIKRRLYDKEGYQRALNFSRIREISENIKNNKILAFPNAIILNSEKNISNDNINEEDCPKIIDLDLPISYCEFKVVDGQHRLMGFANVNKTIQKYSLLPVILFNKLSSKDEIKMFVDINSKQKRVDGNLVLLLKRGFEWNINDNEYYDKIAVIICEELNKQGPLKNIIYFGTVNEKPSNKVRLISMVSMLKSNGFIRKNNALWQKSPEDIKTPLLKTREIIGLINKKIMIKQIINNELLLQTLGLRLIFKFIHIIEKNRLSENISITNNELFEDIKRVFLDGFSKDLKNYYGEGGATNFAFDLSEKLKAKYGEKYKKIETNLRKLKKSNFKQNNLIELKNF